MEQNKPIITNNLEEKTVNKKKIILICVILMIAISSLSIVSSSLVRTSNSDVSDGSRMISVDGGEEIKTNDSSDVSDDVSDDDTYTLKGFKFHIPDGYSKVSEDINDGSSVNKKSTANFTNDKGDYFVITIEPTTPDENTTARNPTTLAGIEGSLTNLGQHSIFTYVKDANSITVSAANENIIEQIIKTD